MRGRKDKRSFMRDQQEYEEQRQWENKIKQVYGRKNRQGDYLMPNWSDRNGQFKTIYVKKKAPGKMVFDDAYIDAHPDQFGPDVADGPKIFQPGKYNDVDHQQRKIKDVQDGFYWQPYAHYYDHKPVYYVYKEWMCETTCPQSGSMQVIQDIKAMAVPYQYYYDPSVKLKADSHFSVQSVDQFRTDVIQVYPIPIVKISWRVVYKKYVDLDFVVGMMPYVQKAVPVGKPLPQDEDEQIK